MINFIPVYKRPNSYVQVRKFVSDYDIMNYDVRFVDGKFQLVIFEYGFGWVEVSFYEKDVMKGGFTETWKDINSNLDVMELFWGRFKSMRAAMKIASFGY